MRIPAFVSVLVVSSGAFGCSSGESAPSNASTCGYVEGAACTTDGSIDIASCFCGQVSAVFVCCVEGRIAIEPCSEQHYGCGVYGVDTGRPETDAATDSRADAEDGAE